MSYKILASIIIVVYCFVSPAKTISKEHFIDNHIQNIINERRLREAGFDEFELTSVDEISNSDSGSLDAASIHRRRRSVEDEDGFYDVNISAFGENFEFRLSHSKSVLHPSATIVTVNNEEEKKYEGPHPDCFLKGDVHSHNGIVSASFCNELTGVIGTDDHEMHFEVLPNHIRKRSLSDKLSTIVARKKRSRKPFVLGKTKDFVIVEESDEQENENHRNKRAVPSNEFEIELAVYCDEDFLTYDLTTTDVTQRLNSMLIKYNAVQFEWGRMDQLNYNVTLSIKLMAFFDTNPLWFNSSSSLGTALEEICLGTQDTSYDHVHVHTGVLNPNLGGIAYQSQVCRPTYRCGVSADAVHTYGTTAHEIGHNMGMYHDADKGCTAPNVGMMGGEGVGWSTCSRDDMNTMLQSGNHGCLWTQDIADNAISPASIQGLTLNPGLPGQVYTADQICEAKYGSNWRYREYPEVVPTFCSVHSCVDLNPGGTYGRMEKQSNSINGLYCSENNICFDGSCTGYSAAQLTNPETREGGWSNWGSWTGCSRTCGRGINFRRRNCDNPTPKNHAGCTGNEYDAIACNTSPCTSDSSYKQTLINQRASETCQRLIDNDVVNGTLYSSVGEIYSEFNWGICEVSCVAAENYTKPSFTRFGLIENGTPCIGSTLTTADKDEYSRRPGYYDTCLEGYCQTFDCNNTLGGTSVNDECGVCGGDDSTCLVRTGTFTNTLSQFSRSDWFELPVGAFNIEMSFTWGDMRQYYIEIHTKEGTPIIASNIVGPSRIFLTGDSPISYGGGIWHYSAYVQIMHAQGPLTDPVVVKVYNLGSNSNVGITYTYSVPLDITSCSGSCDNGGTWNNATCACDCPSGYSGVTCSSQCTTLCQNGAVHNETSCDCICNDKQYGSLCECRYPYNGPNCEMCKIGTCENCGTFDPATCRCVCPAGYGGLQCELTCADVSDNSTCSAAAASDACISDNVNNEQNCMASCGLCTEQSPPAECAQPSREGTSAASSSGDGSSGSSSSSSCTGTQFTCSSDSSCIQSSQECDGIYDCSDRSDEASCSDDSFPTLEVALSCGLVVVGVGLLGAVLYKYKSLKKVGDASITKNKIEEFKIPHTEKVENGKPPQNNNFIMKKSKY